MRIATTTPGPTGPPTPGAGHPPDGGGLMNRLARRIGMASAARPWTTLGIWAAAVAALAVLAGTAGGSFTEDFTAPGSESAQAMDLLDERFPAAADAGALAVFAAPEGETLQDHRQAVTAAVARIAEVDRVGDVADPFTAGTLAPGGRVGYAPITFDAPAPDLGPEPFHRLGTALDPARDAGLTAELGGDAAFINAEVETSGAEAAGLLAALVILLVAFGTVVAAVVPVALALLVVGTGAAGILVLAAVLDTSEAALSIGIMIGLGVGIDYALFVVARYREQRTAGRDNREALATAMGSAGSAVVFAGGTVMLAMAALLITGVGIMVSIGIATSMVVLVAVGTALTVLPAVLTLLGDRIDAGRLPGRRRRGAPARPARPAERTLWWRFAHRVAARPRRYLFAASVLLVVLAAPSLRMDTGFPDAGDDPVSTSHRRAYDLLADGFGPGFNGPLLVVADLAAEGGPDEAGLPALAARIAADPGIASVGEPLTGPDGGIAVLTAVPVTGPADPATSATIERLRELTPDGVLLTGLTAMTDDLTTQLDDSLPLFLGAILLTSFLLLMAVFRSVLVPLKAVLLNLLSIGAAYGVVVAVFQWGWAAGLLGVEEGMTIPSPMPAIMFAVLFGLSMDYEVFLLSRIREEYTAGGDSTESVARGIAATGRLITSAALIMMAVFLAFVANPSPFAAMMGLGLATAIALDATVVRLMLVPAVMALLGRANWWLPRVLDRALPRIGPEAAAPAPAGPSRPAPPQPSLTAASPGEQ
ncbi:MMPL family transporter [Streptomyces sp. YIM 98790]|uniref:MMPL family transporter n=1 Tax=Streptomyces sp. YIM 98790 TaxID=2689077 RepID=UPI001A9F20BF|nr:MMPL family transporter [Streptomyces sp. YIM 98790]